MHNKLLLRVKLPPHRIIWRKSLVLPMLNIALSMNHWARKKLHDDMVAEYTQLILDAYQVRPFAHSNTDTYQVSLGYMIGRHANGRKTGTIDCDGFGIIMKYATDALIKATPIPNDSCHVITESRIKYLGVSPDGEEQLFLQVCKN